MFQQRLYITDSSYVEVSSRIFDNKDQVLLTVFGPKSSTESVLTSFIIDDDDVLKLINILKDSLNREKLWPIKTTLPLEEAQ